MGCDIHLFVQAQVLDVLANGDRPVAASCRGDWRWIRPPESLRTGYNDDRLRWAIHRSYTLFAPLAGVRDQSDDGVDDSARYYRGLPDGMRVVDGHTDCAGDGILWLGDHSYTHFTVEEMLADPVWSQVVTERGDRGSWRDLNAWWFDKVVPHLRAAGPPDRVRLVMGFDS